MTYDEAVGTILECYQLGDFSGWTMCDFDHAKMWRTTKDGRYEIVELLKLYEDDSNTAVSHTYFDPDGRTEPENEWTTYGVIRLMTSTGDIVLQHPEASDPSKNLDRILNLYLKIVMEE
jgi:hypothetical protein